MFVDGLYVMEETDWKKMSSWLETKEGGVGSNNPAKK